MEDQIKIDVKLIQPKEKGLKEVAKEVKKPKVSPSSKHDKGKIVSAPSKRFAGIVTLIAIDPSGEEKGNEFSVPEKEYSKYYSDETKFKFKKKAI